MANDRGSLFAGILLIAFGGLFFVAQMAGGLFRALGLTVGWGQLWPMTIVLTGLAFWLAILVWWDRRAQLAGLAVPGTIVLVNGLLLQYQSLSGHWDSWAYLWTLEPISVGLGLLMLYALGQRARGLLIAASILGGIGIAFLLVFGSIWGGWVLQSVTAIVLILAGVLLLMRGAKAQVRGPFPPE